MSVLQRSASRLCLNAARYSAMASGAHAFSTGVSTSSGSLTRACVASAGTQSRTPLKPFSRGFASEPAPSEDEEREIGNEKVRALVEELAKLDILEFSDLTKLLARKLGLPETPMMGAMMAAPMGAPAGGAAGAGGAAAAPAEEEKTSFTVKLDGFDAAAKIKVIKEIRAITSLGLKEAKELVEGAPCVVKPGVGKEEAEEIKKKLEEVGGKVVLE